MSTEEHTLEEILGSTPNCNVCKKPTKVSDLNNCLICPDCIKSAVTAENTDVVVNDDVKPYEGNSKFEFGAKAGENSLYTKPENNSIEVKKFDEKDLAPFKGWPEIKPKEESAAVWKDRYFKLLEVLKTFQK